MFGLSFSEVIVIAMVALLFLGPDKLPEAARTFGKLSAKFRKTSMQFRRDFYNSIYPPEADPRKAFEEVKRELYSVKNIVAEELKDIKKLDDGK